MNAGDDRAYQLFVKIRLGGDNLSVVPANQAV